MIAKLQCYNVTMLQALTVIIPLFGVNYFLTLVGPDRQQSEVSVMSCFDVMSSCYVSYMSGWLHSVPARTLHPHQERLSLTLTLAML